MKLNKRKGFTVVELVIVIAIIAVLAAVLIPTFAGLVRKANISKDTQLVRNLNTALATATEKPKTMYEALQIAADAGYLVDKINASATSNEILYDSKNNVFCYYNATNPSEGSVEYIPESAQGSQINDPKEYYLLWKIYDKDDDIPAAADQKFSVYLADDAKVPDGGKLTVSVGFDAGTNTKAKEVTYNGTKGNSVVIRTYGGTLTVDADKDTVDHYGKASGVSVTKVANYNEYGNITESMLKVSAGKITVKNGAFVNNVTLDGNTGIELNLSSDAIVRSIKGSKDLIKSNPNKVVTVTDDTQKEVTEKINQSLNDLSKMFNKASKGEYDESKYLEALKAAGVTDVKLYYAVNYTGTVNTVEVDGTIYKAGDMQKYSMGSDAWLKCEVFKVVDGNLQINKISLISSLSRKQIIKVNGNIISIVEDCFEADTTKSLKMGAVSFTDTSDGYVESVSANEFNVIYYSGTSVGRTEVEVPSLVQGDIALIRTETNNGVSQYSTDKYNADDFGSYYMGYNNDKKVGDTTTITKTYIVFSATGEYKGTFTYVVNCSVVDKK